MPTQALVIAHACYGHNSFFKGNYLFRQWTAADAIIDYMVFARRYVMECEERHGARGGRGGARRLPRADGARRRPLPPSGAAVAEGRDGAPRRARGASRAQFNDLLAHPARRRRGRGARGGRSASRRSRRRTSCTSSRSISPKLEPWERELVRIVRKLAQYFYPQAQTKVMNEGWATFWHYTILNRLHEQGQVDDGFMLEFLKSHTNVVSQPAFDPSTTAASIRTRSASRCSPTSGASARSRPTRTAHWFPDIAGSDWQQGARLRDAQLQGRVVHRAVPVAAADPRAAPVRRRRPSHGEHAQGRQHPRRARLPPRAQAAGAAARPREARARHPDRPATTATATAR